MKHLTIFALFALMFSALLGSTSAHAATPFCKNGKIAKSVQRKYSAGIDTYYLRNTNQSYGFEVGRIPSQTVVRFNVGIENGIQPVNRIVAYEFGGTTPFPRLHPDTARYWSVCGKIHVGGPMTMGCLKQQTYDWLSDVFCSGK